MMRTLLTACFLYFATLSSLAQAHTYYGAWYQTWTPTKGGAKIAGGLTVRIFDLGNTNKFGAAEFWTEIREGGGVYPVSGQWRTTDDPNIIVITIPANSYDPLHVWGFEWRGKLNIVAGAVTGTWKTSVIRGKFQTAYTPFRP